MEAALWAPAKVILRVCMEEDHEEMELPSVMPFKWLSAVAQETEGVLTLRAQMEPWEIDPEGRGERWVMGGWWWSKFPLGHCHPH